MQDEQTSPKINSITWGRIEVEDHGTFKDARIYPGGAEEWDWNQTGTRHSPGVQPADVRSFLERGVGIIVIGTGYHERLEIQPETLEMLDERGVEVYVRETEEALRLLAGLEEAGALIHSTC
jgi:hypothetical protein